MDARKNGVPYPGRCGKQSKSKARAPGRGRGHGQTYGGIIVVSVLSKKYVCGQRQRTAETRCFGLGGEEEGKGRGRGYLVLHAYMCVCNSNREE